MFGNNPFNKKKDPVLESVQAAMQDGATRRQAEALVNEQFGVYSRKAVVREQLAAYDAALEETYQSLKEGVLDNIKSAVNNANPFNKAAQAMGGSSPAEAKPDMRIMTPAKPAAPKDGASNSAFPANEETQIDEISRRLATSYRDKATNDYRKRDKQQIDLLDKADETESGKKFQKYVDKADDLRTKNRQRMSGLDMANDKLKGRARVNVKEEQIDEISNKTKGAYLGSAVADLTARSKHYGGINVGAKAGKFGRDLARKIKNRQIGIANATKDIREEEQIDERNLLDKAKGFAHLGSKGMKRVDKIASKLSDRSGNWKFGKGKDFDWSEKGKEQVKNRLKKVKGASDYALSEDQIDEATKYVVSGWDGGRGQGATTYYRPAKKGDKGPFYSRETVDIDRGGHPQYRYTKIKGRAVAKPKAQKLSDIVGKKSRMSNVEMEESNQIDEINQRKATRYAKIVDAFKNAPGQVGGQDRADRDHAITKYMGGDVHKGEIRRAIKRHLNKKTVSEDSSFKDALLEKLNLIAGKSVVAEVRDDGSVYRSLVNPARTVSRGRGAVNVPAGQPNVSPVTQAAANAPSATPVAKPVATTSVKPATGAAARPIPGSQAIPAAAPSGAKPAAGRPAPGPNPATAAATATSKAPTAATTTTNTSTDTYSGGRNKAAFDAAFNKARELGGSTARFKFDGKDYQAAKDKSEYVTADKQKDVGDLSKSTAPAPTTAPDTSAKAPEATGSVTTKPPEPASPTAPTPDTAAKAGTPPKRPANLQEGVMVGEHKYRIV